MLSHTRTHLKIDYLTRSIASFFSKPRTNHSEKKMLTSQEIRVLLTKYLNSADFTVLQHEMCSGNASRFSIKAMIQTEDARSEVRFTAKTFLRQFQWKSTGNSETSLTSTFSVRDDLIVFEDAAENGFSWTKQPQTLDLDHIKIALEALAHYHAEKINCKAESETVQKRVTDCEFLTNSITAALTAVGDLLSEEDLKKELAKTVQSSLNLLQQKFCKVVCHGYMCGDSVVFRYENEVPVECKLLNFNTQQYAPPGYDVLHFIYTTTDTEFQKNHLHELLKFYYECLKVELQKRNLKVENLLPLEEDFELSIHHLLPIIKVQLAQFYQLHCSNPDFCKTNKDEAKKRLTHFLKDLKDLVSNPGLTLEDCFYIARNKLSTNNYELVTYQLVPLEKVSGFFGDHKKLKITVRVDGETQTMNFFVKFTPKGSAQKSIADDCGSFYKENFFYRHFVPMAQEVGATIINDCTVPCYLTRLDDVMVFEDFGIRNYGTLNPRQPLNYEEVEIIVKQLAKFHASSLILEEKFTEKNKTRYCLKDHYEKGLQESFFTKIPNHQGAQSMNMSAEVMEDQIKLFPNPNSTLTDEEFKMRIRAVYEKVFDLVKPSEEFRSAICHGDLWVSNILVKKIDEKHIDCRFVDFQIMRYCPPAQDLLGFIHLTTNRSFRRAHMDTLIDLYHAELSKAFETCGCDVEKIYPYENFRKSIEYMRPQAVFQTCIYYHICVGNPDLLKDYMQTEEQIKQIFLEDRRDFLAEMCERDPLYKERNGEAMQDLRELCEKYI